MRFLLPVAAAAALLCAGLPPATAKQSQHQQRKPVRAKAHVSVHLSGHHVVKGKGIKVRGKVRPGGRHRVKVVFRGSDRGMIRTRTRRDGVFAVRFKPRRTGSYKVRAYGVHNRRARGSRSPGRRLTAYRLAGASYYGPGLYGNGVACGGTLNPGTMGVAHKSLPCGTRVKLRYRGRNVTVPVIDRGPYVAGRDYDLTEAVRNRLGFPGVDTVLASR